MNLLRVLPALVILSVGFVATLHRGGSTVNAAQTAQVYVTNSGAGQAIPTAAQGTTPISGAVSITGTPSVNVANIPSNPVPTRGIDYPALRPYVSDCTGTPGGPSVVACRFDATPPGTGVVIEVVSCFFEMSVGRRPDIAVLSQNLGGSAHDVYLPFTFNGPRYSGTTAVGDDFTISLPLTRIYAEGTGNAPANIFVYGDGLVSGPNSLQCEIFGHLVDLAG
jgi:hypothetical protein